MIQNFIKVVEAIFGNKEIELVSILSQTKLDADKVIGLCKDFKKIIDPNPEISFFEKLIRSEVASFNGQKIFKIVDESFQQINGQKKDLDYLKKLFTIAATIFVSTNSAEHSFSKLNLIKSHLRA